MKIFKSSVVPFCSFGTKRAGLRGGLLSSSPLSEGAQVSARRGKGSAAMLRGYRALLVLVMQGLSLLRLVGSLFENSWDSDHTLIFHNGTDHERTEHVRLMGEIMDLCIAATAFGVITEAALVARLLVSYRPGPMAVAASVTLVVQITLQVSLYLSIYLSIYLSTYLPI